MDKKAQKRVNAPLIYASFKRPRVTALLGARRVGKTTLLKSYMHLHSNNKWVFLNMDNRESRLRVENGKLSEVIEQEVFQQIGVGGKIWVAIDEAQKCPALFDQVKILYDQFKDQDKIKFILTGSGHLNLHQLAAESLAGRVELMHLREFNLKEMAKLTHPDVSIPEDSILDLLIEPFDENTFKSFAEKRQPFQKLLNETMTSHLVWGGLPEVLQENSANDRLRYLANYLQTYLENDVRAIETISDLSLYQNLMKTCAEQLGSLRDDQKVVNALGCSRNTLLKYRGYLSATMQYLELYPLINSTLKRLVKSPKGYLLNNGLVSYLTGVRELSILNATGLLGHRFENWFLSELLTWTDRLVENHSIHFWRTSGGAEVDFVITIGAQIIPIEVTHSSQLLPKKARHLREFIENESKAKWGIYLYNGPYKVEHDQKIICLPFWMV
ncbi:MAG: ATP-binding protein [Chlamydiales bacterium]|nr:ATP-binding protein [Chlamydiales bacterium]